MDRFEIATFEYVRVEYRGREGAAHSLTDIMPAVKRFVETAAREGLSVDRIVLGYKILVLKKKDPSFRARPDRVFAETVLTLEEFAAVNGSWFDYNGQRAGDEIDRYVVAQYGAVLP